MERTIVHERTAVRERTAVGERSGVERWPIGAGDRRRAPVAGGPELEIVIGARLGLPVGVLEVTVPAGGAMPEHDHGVSEALLVPLEGSLRLVEPGEPGGVTDLEPGVLATIPAGCRVRLENSGEEDSRLLVVLTPADFVAQLEGWPAPGEAALRA